MPAKAGIQKIFIIDWTLDPQIKFGVGLVRNDGKVDVAEFFKSKPGGSQAAPKTFNLLC